MLGKEYRAIAQRFTISVIVAGLLRVVQQHAAAVEARDQPTSSSSAEASAEASAVPRNSLSYDTLAAEQRHAASDAVPASQVCTCVASFYFSS
jgi:hypothetical protein